MLYDTADSATEIHARSIAQSQRTPACVEPIGMFFHKLRAEFTWSRDDQASRLWDDDGLREEPDFVEPEENTPMPFSIEKPSSRQQKALANEFWLRPKVAQMLASAGK
jgi:hypothetical protein